MKIGVFGGTFDPVHNGHINAFVEAYIGLDLDQIIIVPTYVSPLKNSANSSDSERLAMLKLAVEPFEFVSIDTSELEGAVVSYTFDTLSTLKLKYPTDDLFFIIGTDHYLNFDKWAHSEALHDLAQFVVINRDDSELEIQPPFKHLKTNIVEISSTTIRERLKTNTEIRHLVNPNVFKFIKEQRIYET